MSIVFVMTRMIGMDINTSLKLKKSKCHWSIFRVLKGIPIFFTVVLNLCRYRPDDIVLYRKNSLLYSHIKSIAIMPFKIDCLTTAIERLNMFRSKMGESS